MSGFWVEKFYGFTRKRWEPMSGKFKERQRHTPSFGSIGKCKNSELACPNMEPFQGIKENMILIPLIQRAFSALPFRGTQYRKKAEWRGEGKWGQGRSKFSTLKWIHILYCLKKRELSFSDDGRQWRGVARKSFSRERLGWQSRKKCCTSVGHKNT